MVLWKYGEMSSDWWNKALNGGKSAFLEKNNGQGWMILAMVFLKQGMGIGPFLWNCGWYCFLSPPVSDLYTVLSCSDKGIKITK